MGLGLSVTRGRKTLQCYPKPCNARAEISGWRQDQLPIACPTEVAQLQILTYFPDGIKWIDSGASIQACSADVCRPVALFPGRWRGMGTVPIFTLWVVVSKPMTADTVVWGFFLRPSFEIFQSLLAGFPPPAPLTSRYQCCQGREKPLSILALKS